MAVKRIDKFLVQKENKVGAVHREKLIMKELSSHHLSLKLLNTFQDDDYIYFLTEHGPHGTLTQLASLYPDKKVPLNIV